MFDQLSYYGFLPMTVIKKKNKIKNSNMYKWNRVTSECSLQHEYEKRDILRYLRWYNRWFHRLFRFDSLVIEKIE